MKEPPPDPKPRRWLFILPTILALVAPWFVGSTKPLTFFEDATVSLSVFCFFTLLFVLPFWYGSRFIAGLAKGPPKDPPDP